MAWRIIGVPLDSFRPSWSSGVRQALDCRRVKSTTLQDPPFGSPGTLYWFQNCHWEVPCLWMEFHTTSWIPVLEKLLSTRLKIWPWTTHLSFHHTESFPCCSSRNFWVNEREFLLESEWGSSLYYRFHLLVAKSTTCRGMLCGVWIDISHTLCISIV